MPTLTTDEVRDLSPNALYVEASPGPQKDVALLTELSPRHGFVGFIGDKDALLQRVKDNQSGISFEKGVFLCSQNEESEQGEDLILPHFTELTLEEALHLCNQFLTKDSKIKIVLETYNDVSDSPEYQELEKLLSDGNNTFMPFGEFEDTDESPMLTVDDTTGRVSSTKGFRDVFSNVFSPIISTLSNHNWQLSAKKALTDSGKELSDAGREKLHDLNETIKSALTKTKESAESLKDSAEDVKESATQAVDDTVSDNNDSHNADSSGSKEDPTGTGIYDDSSANEDSSTDSNYEPDTVKFVSSPDSEAEHSDDVSVASSHEEDVSLQDKDDDMKHQEDDDTDERISDFTAEGNPTETAVKTDSDLNTDDIPTPAEVIPPVSISSDKSLKQ